MAKTPTKKNKSTDIATTSEDKPAYLQGIEDAGGIKNEDNFTNEDVIIPRIKLLQGLSPELDLFDNAKSGVFWHTGFDQPLGESVDFVICSRKKKLMLVAPLDDGQGILARSEDCITWDRLGEWDVKIDKKTTVTWEINDLSVKETGLDKWGTFDPDDTESPPAATIFYEYLVLLPDHLEWGPVVISLTRSQIKKAKKGLNDKIALHEGAGRPMQAICFRASSINDESNGNSFKNWQFTGNGFANESLYTQARELKDLLKDYVVQDEDSAVQEGTVPTSDTDDF